jgi:peptidoglycan/LPS O-acetylase OafA/YrhL
MVQWSSGLTRKYAWLAILFGALVVALMMEWRSRLLVAMVTALILGAGLHLKPIFHAHVHGLLSTLGRISYSVFLIHYPVVLMVGTVVTYLWAGDVLANAVGLVVAWLLTLWCGSVLYQRVERPRFAATLERPAASSGRS